MQKVLSLVLVLLLTFTLAGSVAVAQETTVTWGFWGSPEELGNPRICSRSLYGRTSRN